jgi:predicted dehydrogenase
VLKAICARDEAKAKAFAATWGYESVETDWRKLVARKDIDAIDVCIPNNLHREVAIAAAAAGKMILCEKPLAMNSQEGAEMVAAVERAGVTTGLVQLSPDTRSDAGQKLIDGRLGRIFITEPCSQDWTISADLPQGGTALWQLDAAAAGSGVTGACWRIASIRHFG